MAASHGRVVAARCLVEGLPLATLNIKDFEDFAEYNGLRLLTSGT
jgi:toxin FitB